MRSLSSRSSAKVERTHRSIYILLYRLLQKHRRCLLNIIAPRVKQRVARKGGAGIKIPGICCPRNRINNIHVAAFSRIIPHTDRGSHIQCLPKNPIALLTKELFGTFYKFFAKPNHTSPHAAQTRVCNIFCAKLQKNPAHTAIIQVICLQKVNTI